MEVKLETNFLNAIKKTGALLNLPKATKFLLTKWSSETVKALKEKAQSMKKSGRKSRHLARNIGQKISQIEDKFVVVVGTGKEVGKEEVKYARILDQGGVIKPVRRKFLTIPFPRVAGVAEDYPGSLVICSKAGNLLIVERRGRRGIKPLFLLKKEVHMPAFHWFSDIVSRREDELRSIMTEENIFKTAEAMERK